MTWGGFAAFALGWFVVLPFTDRDVIAAVPAFGGFIVGSIGMGVLGTENGESAALLRTKRGERWSSLGYKRDSTR